MIGREDEAISSTAPYCYCTYRGGTNQLTFLSSEGHVELYGNLHRLLMAFELVVGISRDVVSTNQPAFSCLLRDIVELYGHLHGLHVCNNRIDLTAHDLYGIRLHAYVWYLPITNSKPCP